MASLATRPALHKGTVGPLRDRCALCLVSRPRLLLCTGCRAVRYCSREHQVKHRAAHKTDCVGIKKERDRVAKEDHLVRNQEGDFMTPANAFETDVGHFYGILETRVYIRARFILADHLRLMGTPDSVGEAADHILDMLRLNRSDNLGQRDFLPAILLRLDRDQEAYDFVKWWATCDPNGTYDWGDMSEPHMNLKGEDVMEAPDFLCREHPDLSHLVAVFLLKMKLLIDIRAIKVSRWVLTKNSPLPAELQLAIEPEVVRSPLSVKLFVGKSTDELTALEIQLSRQARTLGAEIQKTNDSFIPVLFDPDEALVIHPPSYAPGSYEHAALALQQTHAAIWETAGVLEILKDARQCAARDSENEVAEIFESISKKNKPGRQRTPAELLENVSLNRIWGYFSWAVQNASYLGQWADRPSERYTKRLHAQWDELVAEEKEMAREEEWSDTDGSDDDN